MNKKYIFLLALGLLILVLLPFVGITKIDITSLFEKNNSSFIFGKTNLFLNLRGGWGKQKEIFRKV